MRHEIANGEVCMPVLRIYVKYTICITIILVIIASRGLALPFDVDRFVSNMKDRNDQTVLSGPIDSLVIIRPQVEFRLGPGELTIFNFGATRPSAMVYEGKGRFNYTPPDDVERGQLVKFTKKESLDEEFEKMAFFFTIELDDFPDTSNFIREKAAKKAWNILADAVDDAFDHLRINMPNKLIGDLLAGSPGGFFYVDFDNRKIGSLVFMEDPFEDDQFQLIKLARYQGVKFGDVLGGYTPDGSLVSQRGVIPIDITHYKIDSDIEGSGKMMVECRIEFTPLRWGYQFPYFTWYYKNKDISAIDSNGDSLTVIHRKDERGFGVVTNKTLELGKADFIDIVYECKSLFSVYGLFYIYGKTSWFPSSSIRDCATFELVYDIPKSYQVVSCGKKIELSEESGRSVSRWIVDQPVEYVSFNLGVFESKEIIVENLPPVKVFMSEQIDHQAIALYRAYFGDLSAADMIGQVSADVTNSLAFFTSIFGPCPFDTIKATEIPFTGEGQGSPGLIHLTWSTFQTDDIQGYSETFRAHEVAHQWWGHLVDKDSYRDVWITEGLANYSGLWFYELSAKDTKAVKNMLKYWREAIISGAGARSVGSKAGPIIIGSRLFSSKSSDYSNLIYKKGAYIFHMIRYLLHDYKTGSDDAFAAFLKDIVDTFRGKVITTEGLQTLVEKHTGAEMGWFFDQWVYGTAIPEYRFGYDSEKTDDGKYAVVCHVMQEKVPDNFQMLVPITVLFEDDRYIHLKLWIDQPEADIDLALLPFEPQKIIFNTFDAVLCKVKYE